MTLAGVPETIIDMSLITSLFVFGIRVLIKEVKAVLGDMFQIFEFILQWWILIREQLTWETPQAIAVTKQLSE